VWLEERRYGRRVSQSPTLIQLFDDSALLSFEHQLHLSELLGQHRWEVNFDERRFEFVGDHPLVCTGLHLLGSAAPGPRSWLWSWANPWGYPAEVTGLAASVRDFGQRHGIPELANGEVPFDALPGSPAEPNQIAWMMGEAAKAVSHRWTSYTGDAGGGTRLAVLIEHPDFALPAPAPARVMRVLQQGLLEVPMNDHRRAVHSYAVGRGLAPAFNGDFSQLTITGPQLEAVVHFNDRGLIDNISGSIGAGR
jgi:hypothetical protein